MTILRFPLRRTGSILIVRKRGGDGWIVLARKDGWSFGSRADAMAEAQWIARNLGLPVRELVS